MKLLVTGAGGLLGRACVSLASQKHDCLGLSREELDVTDRPAVQRAIERLQPNAVLHCAAYTDVDGAERDPDRATEVNAVATGWVARAARQAGARMVYVSTDYVFDGDKQTPYTEEDVPNPLSRYGLSKLEGERRVAELCPDNHLIVRSGWVYGAGKGFVDWVLGRLDRGETLRVVNDQVGSPTWVGELAKALLVLTEKPVWGTFHFVNKGETHWLGVARVIAECLGVEHAPLEELSLADLARPAPRPRYSALDVTKFEDRTGERVAPWNDAVASYLAALGRLPNLSVQTE